MKKNRNKSNKSVFILGKDSHKSAFDGITLAGCDAILLPCIREPMFGISLGVLESHIKQAIDEYRSDVRFIHLLINQQTHFIDI